ncbi:MAG: MBL fold metallo-hydrolase [Solirubrobacteraceae bacterium]|jgi:L-ascorbate metabolism protein UlaG (beta-lactamase superfamily)
MTDRAPDRRSAQGEPQLAIQLVGGPTAILEYGGLRWLIDPALSPPGEYGGLTKLTGPAVDVSEQDPIDVVLVSHHHHSDNLDPDGTAFLPSARHVLSTTKAAEELGGNVVGMEPWSEVDVDSPLGAKVKVTAVHAQHGPDGSDEMQGPVLGFVLSAPGAERVYVSGDNASRKVVRAIVEKTGELGIAVLNAGAVQLSKFDGAYLTLSADHAADVAQILGARVVIPLHFEGWAHFTQGADELEAAFRGNGIRDRLVMLERGQRVEV